jgi:SOS-response transcriptional repressor LexA
MDRKRKLPKSIAEWGEASGLSRKDFINELLNTVTALGGMMMDHHDEPTDTITLNIESNNEMYTYDLTIQIERTKNEQEDKQ